MTCQPEQERSTYRPCCWVHYVVWAAAAAAITSCTSYRQIDIEIPVSAKIDVSRFERIFVAGFVTESTESLNLDIETVRLLRGQLRNQSRLTVLDVAPQFLGDFSASTLEQNGKMEEFRRFQETLDRNDGEQYSLEEWTAYEMEKILLDEEYWRKLGEEYQEPLIVSGIVKLMSRSRASHMSSALPRNANPFARPRPRGAPSPKRGKSH